jgi:hypothetical protein
MDGVALMLWNQSLNQILDRNGRPLPGARALFFRAGTSTPLVTYADSGYNTPRPHPVLADENGRFPAIYIPPGVFRSRVETPSRIAQWDVDDLQSIDPTEDTGGGGGGGGDVDPTLLPQTGDLKLRHGRGLLVGWVRCNGRSIGSAVSGAEERANDDTEDLFRHLWEADEFLTVDGGRGTTAEADWQANKRIATPDFRGRPFVGIDGMGNVRAGILDADDGDKVGFKFGEATVALDIENLPEHDHGGETSETGDHFHLNGIANSQPNIFVYGPVTEGMPGEATQQVDESTGNRAYQGKTQTTGKHKHTIEAEGEGEAHNNLPPGIAGTVYIKL